MELNIDERLAAKADVDGEPRALAFRGRTWELPAKLQTLNLSEGLRLVEQNPVKGYSPLFLDLFGEEQYRDLLGLKLADDELTVIFTSVLELYGLSAPESAASGGSLKSNGVRSRPTSKTSTASTSLTPSTVPTP